MRLDAGRLRHLVTVEEYDGSTGAFNEPEWGDDAHWRVKYVCRAAVDPISGREYYAAGQEGSAVTHKVRLRYHAGITPAMRLRLGEAGRRLEILSVIDWEERHESLLLMCRERTG